MKNALVLHISLAPSRSTIVYHEDSGPFRADFGESGVRHLLGPTRDGPQELLLVG